MQILRPLPVSVRNTDPGDDFSDPSLIEIFKSLSGRDTAYILRTEVFDLLVDLEAEFADQTFKTAHRRLRPHRAAGPIQKGDEYKVRAIFDPRAKSSALWLDRIMANLAFYDGFKRFGADPFILETTHATPVDYIPDLFSRPRSVSEWQGLSKAWLSYLLYDEAEKDTPVPLYLLTQAMMLMRLEMNYAVSFRDRGKDFSLVFTGGFDGRASIRFWTEPESDSVQYALASPEGLTNFPAALTMGRLNELIFDTLKNWHERAGVLDLAATQAFDQRLTDLNQLQKKVFHSGLDPYTADVVALPGPRSGPKG